MKPDDKTRRNPGADMRSVTPRLMQMMRELVDKYPDGYEGYRDEINPSGHMLPGSGRNEQAEVSAAPEIASRMKDMSI